MQLRLSLLSVLLLFQVFAVGGTDQGVIDTNAKITELKARLAASGNPQVRVRLEYELGDAIPLSRAGYWDTIVAEANAMKMTLIEGKALRRLASLLEQTEDKRKAGSYYERSAKILEEAGDFKELLLSLESLSRYYVWIDRDMKKALENCFRGLKIAEEIKDKKSITLFNAITAQCYFSARDMKKSLQMQFKCLEDYRKIGYNPGIVEALMDIGMAYCGLGDNEGMIKYYLQSKEEMEKHMADFENTFLATQVYHSTGAAYSLTKEYDSAFKYTYKAFLYYAKQGKKRGMASVMSTLAYISYERGNNQAALEMALKTYEIVKEIDFYAQIPDLMILLRKIYSRDNNYKEALNAYTLYVEAKDSLSSENTRKLISETEFRYDLDKKENENRLLAQQNQIQALKLRQSRILLFGLLLFVSMLAALAFLVFKQNRLRNLQKSSLLEQKLLRSQLNPHFIFNALNSVMQFIVLKENDKAERYLAKFSKLIRKLLESSVSESLSVGDEVEMLNDYVAIESLRFSNSFTYSIAVDKNVDPGVRIPHMLVQPFVENAIWHGLLHKKGNRHLDVTFYREGDRSLRCLVSDNGAGIGKGSGPGPGKKSLALNIIGQRLELMKKITGIDCRIKIANKTAANGEIIGAEAIIILPIIEK